MWNEKDSLAISDGPPAAISSILQLQNKSHISQFFINPRPEFESIRMALIIERPLRILILVSKKSFAKRYAFNPSNFFLKSQRPFMHLIPQMRQLSSQPMTNRPNIMNAKSLVMLPGIVKRRNFVTIANAQDILCLNASSVPKAGMSNIRDVRIGLLRLFKLSLTLIMLKDLHLLQLCWLLTKFEKWFNLQ